MALILRELTDADEAAFLAGWDDWKGEDPLWYSFAWKEGMTYPEMMEILRKEKAGLDLAPDRVPHSMLYGFVDGKIVGRVSVRHILNDYLRSRGGHIGYAVAPAYRQRGYATEMVRQALRYCRHIGIGAVMVTCADDNVPSWKLIERFGGVLEDKVIDETDGELTRRYWIPDPATALNSVTS